MPGQFVRVHLVGATYKNAILIPSSAVLNTQNGMIAYVIDENDSLVSRPIQAHLQNDMYIVTDGLKAGERVVSGGLAKVRAGQHVQVQMKEFSIPAKQEEVQPAQEDGRSVAELEKVIENSESPDMQAVPNEAAQEAVPAAAANEPVTK